MDWKQENFYLKSIIVLNYQMVTMATRYGGKLLSDVNATR